MLKRFLFLLLIYSISFIYIFSSVAQAADIQAQLDSNNGSSGLSIQKLNGTEVGRVDSNGNLTTQGNVGVGTSSTQALLDVTTGGGTGPEYAQLAGGIGAGSDAYIANDMAVDGTAYFNNVQVDGMLSATGLHFTGQQTLDSLLVTGPAFLGTIAGNVGIGTVNSGGFFAVGSTSQFKINATGAITAVTGITTTGGYVQTGGSTNTLSGITLFSNNVGINSANPGQSLDVTGTVRTTGFVMSGQGPTSGYVLTAIDGTGNATWSAPGNISGAPWLQSGTNVYTSGSNNVGIGTTTPQGAFVVTNGNVGIGTWAPTAPLAVGTNAFTVSANGVVATSGAYTQSGVGANTLTGTTNFTAANTSASFTNNVGIGTTTAQAALVVANGNVGIGTWTAAGGSLIVARGNVGIGSLAPGQVLDVTGTVRTTGFVMSGQGPTSGYVLTAIDGTGNATWSAPGNISGAPWLQSGSNVYTSGSNNVGIGTTTPQGAFVVTNGNVGIGTWVPANILDVKGIFQIDKSNNANAFNLELGGTPLTGDTDDLNLVGSSSHYGLIFNGGRFVINQNGNVGVGTINVSTSALTVMNGNVGIGTWVPGQTMDVQGTVRTTGFVMSGQGPTSGYVLTAIDGTGNATWTAPGNISGAPWLQSGNNVYTSGSNNVGIGTTTPQGAFVVTNGNVGIGTWVPVNPLQVGSTFSVTLGGGITGSGLTENATNANLSNISTNSGANVKITGGANVNSFLQFYSTSKTGNSDYIDFEEGNVGVGTVDVMRLVNGNVGIGTITPQAALTVTYGNVGIGTWTAAGGALMVQGGNVGIGTVNANQALTVNGEIYSTSGGILFPDNTLQTTAASGGNSWTMASGNVYTTTASNNVGIGTAAPTGFEIENHNVGIGTAFTAAAGLTVMNGNVGIGTWVPNSTFQVIGSVSLANGNLTITAGGTVTAGPGVAMSSPAAGLNNSNATAGSKLTITGGASTTSQLILNSTSKTGNGDSIVFNFGNVGVGTSTVEMTNGNVGIGSINPGTALDVTGTVRATAFIGNGSQLTGLAQSQWTTTNTNDVYLPSNGNVGIGTTITSAGAALTVMNGNVGIGTWVPSALLSFPAGTTAANGINFGDAGADLYRSAASHITTDGSLTVVTNLVVSAGQTTLFNGATTQISLALKGRAAQTGDMLDIYPLGTNLVDVFNASGNLGIGTVAPVSQLNVNGGVGIGTSLTNGAYLNGNSAPSGGLIVQNNVGIGTFNPFGGNLIVNGGGNVGIGSLTPGTTLDVNGTIRSISGGFTFPDGSTQTTAASGGNSWTMASGNVYTTTASNNVGIGTAAPTGFEIENHNVGIGTAFTTAAGLTVMNGNVGIGTWVPAYTLDVIGGNGVRANSGLFTSTWALSGQNIYYSSALRDSIISGALAGGGAYNLRFLSGSSGDTGGSITMETDGAEVLRVTNGNIGIGTLAVENVGIGTISAQGALVVTSGNVGIGTWAPANPFQVGTVASGAYIDSSGDITAHGYIVTSSYLSAANATYSGSFTGAFNSNTIFQLRAATYRYDFQDSSNNHLVSILSNGNVGIGTTVPGAELDVEGTLYPTVFYGHGTDFNVGIGSITPGQALDVTGTVRATAFIGNGSQLTGLAQSQWTTTNTNDVYLPSNGNVGIGTTITSAGAALTVMNGNVGIGTWKPNMALELEGGNVGIGTYISTATLNLKNSISLSNETSSVGIVSVHSQDDGVGGSGIFVSQATSAEGTWIYPSGLDSYTPKPDGTVNTLDGTLYLNEFSTGEVILAGGGGGVQFGDPNHNTSTILNYIFGVSNFYNNIGIGTATPAGALTVMSGNVGVGTWVPGQSLDVKGTVRTTGFVMSGQGPTSGYVLTAIDGTGNATWTAPGNISGAPWLQSGTNIYTSGNNNVGIGTSSPTGFEIENHNVGIGTAFTNSGAALTVMNGNVGIGTWIPAALLQIGASGPGPLGSTIDASGFHVGRGLYYNLDNNGFWYLGSNRDQMAAGTEVASGAYPWVISSGASNLVGGYISFQTSGVERARVTDTGVGIGTIVPSSQLNINGGVGIGTSLTNGAYLNGNSAPSGGLIVQGNVGIGTFNPFGGGLIVLPASTGNVGIGSLTPGQPLDVQGTVRTTGFVMSGQGPASGDVLTAIDGTGNTTWTSAGNVGTNYWLNNGGSNVGINTTQAVGIGTSFVGGTGEAALSVMNGNVGIGTWVPSVALQVNGAITSNGNITANNGNVLSGYQMYIRSNALDIWGAPLTLENSAANMVFSTSSSFNPASNVLRIGNIPGTPTTAFIVPWTTSNGMNLGIGTFSPVAGLAVVGNVGIGTMGGDSYITTTPPTGGMIMYGNLGIGSITPGQKLDVQGTVRATAFIGNGSQLTGLTSSQWTTTNTNDVYLPSNGNVGLGTTITSAGAALTVMNGNVGIGTWVPGAALDIIGNVRPTNVDLRNGGSVIVGGLSSSFGSTSGNPWIRAINGASIWMTTGNSDSLREIIDTNGNVGLGTTTPVGGLAVMNGNVGIGTWAPNSTLHVNGSQAWAYANVSSNTTLDGTYYIVNVDSTGGTVTITLPTAVGVGGRCYKVKDTGGQAATNNITIASNGGNIDGLSTKIITDSYQGYDVCSNNANWFVY